MNEAAPDRTIFFTTVLSFHRPPLLFSPLFLFQPFSHVLLAPSCPGLPFILAFCFFLLKVLLSFFFTSLLCSILPSLLRLLDPTVLPLFFLSLSQSFLPSPYLSFSFLSILSFPFLSFPFLSFPSFTSHFLCFAFLFNLLSFPFLSIPHLSILTFSILSFPFLSFPSSPSFLPYVLFFL